jgi:ATPase subunit of ABC transporter with duplicated ATPase domains
MQYNSLLEQIVNGVEPQEMADLIREQDHLYLHNSSTIAEDKALRLVEHLSVHLTPDKFLELEDVWLEDLPEISLQDGEIYKPINHLSEGQRCTTILPLLLLYDPRPLIIDEPEVHLDNAYITATVVPAILKVKSQRQLLFATHNPNIPVLGEAENDLVMLSDGRRGWVGHQGDLSNPEVNSALQRLLEGGSEALKGRLDKYESQ